MIFALATPLATEGRTNTTVSQPWWNDNYAYKRNVFIQNSVGNNMVTGYPVHLHFDSGTAPTAADLYAASQASITGDDFRIIYNETMEVSRWIQRFSSSQIDIWFKTQADIGGSSSNNTDYQLYYGNPSATNPPNDIDDVMPPGKDANTIGLWHFADGSGSTFIDTSGRGHHGNLVNAHAWGDDTFGPYIEWFGGGDGAAWGEVGSSSDFDLNSMTLEAWVYPISAGATPEQTVIYRPRSSPENCPGYKLSVTDIKVDLQLNCAGGRAWDGQLSADRWYHIAGVFDGGTMRIYRDGSLIRTVSYNQNVHSTSGRSLFFGGSPFSQTFRGRVRHVRISNIARSDFTYAANIAAITVAPSLRVDDAMVRDTTPPVCAPTPSGLVSWWPGDESANDIQDGNHGVLQNGATFAAGKVKQAFSLDGVHDLVSVADANNLDFGTSDFSVEFWVNFNDLVTGDNGLLSKDTYAGNLNNFTGWLFNICDDCGGGGFGVGSAGIGLEVRNRVNGSGPHAHARYATANFQTGRWYHLAGVRQSNVLYFYVDGILRATTAEPSPINVTNNAPLTVGSLTPASRQFFEGLIDEVGIYSRALTTAEIHAIFNAGGAGKCRPSVDTTPPMVSVTMPTTPDGENGWFVTSPVGGSVTADDTTTGGNNITAITCTGATVGPITGLGTPSASASLTVSGEGIHNVSCTATDSAGNTGSSNTSIIMIDTIVPTFSCAMAPTTWSSSDVSRTCSANDEGSGLATAANFSLTTNVPNGTETDDALSNTAEVCDNAGNCVAAGPLDGNKVDKKAPVQTGCDTPDDAWHPNNVTLNCTYNDGGSGPVTQTVDLTTNVPAGTEDANASASANGAQACDNVGNCATSPTDIPSNMIDRKAPHVSCASADTNWHGDNQSVTCSATDDGSGLANQTFTLSTSVLAGDETNNAFTNSALVCDAVNNCTTAGPVGPFKIDKKGPDVVCTATPTYLLNQAGATVSATITDGGSGPAVSPVSVIVSTSAVGSYTTPVTGFDNVGNSTTTSCPYNVTYNFSNFLPPVDNLPTFNEVKAGASVPVKFSLNGNMGLNIFETGYPKSQEIPCDSTAPVDGIEETVTAGSSVLSYDASTDQYTYTWKTNKAWANTCRQLVLKLNDGTYHRANFKFK